MFLPAFLLRIDIAENRTLCRARALSKREAFVASGRGRRQPAEAGADLRSKYADSPRNASALYRCDVYRISACHAPHQWNPKPAENRTLCRARALSKREAFVASGRGRRQPAEAGADLRSKCADSPRKASTLCRCDADQTAACHAPHQRRPRRKIHPRIPAQTGMRFPDDVSSGKYIPESALRTGRAFPTAVQAESASHNPASNWGALSASPAASKNLRALHPKTG